MNEIELRARLVALERLIVNNHDRCKAGTNTIEELVDLFYQHHFLAQAFAEECQEHMGTISPEHDLFPMLRDIGGVLSCGMGHLVDCQDKLKTTIITDLIKNILAMRNTQIVN